MKGSLNIIPGVQGAMSRSTSRDGKCRKRDGAFSTNRRLEKPQLKAFMKLATKCRDMVRPEFPISLQSCSAVGDTVIFPPPSFVSPPLFFLDPLILILLLSPQPVSLLPFISCQGSIFFKKTEVQLILSVVFVSCVQQSESTLYIHIHPLFFFTLSPYRPLIRALRRVACAIQQVLISYLFYTHHQQCIFVNSNVPIHPLGVHMFVIYVCVFIVVQLLSYARLFVTPWTAAHQAPLSSIISQSLLKLMSIDSSVLVFQIPHVCVNI